MNIKKNRSLLELNTFGVDSVAAHYLKITEEDELTEAVRYVEKNRLGFLILGGGSNMLLTEPKLNKAVLHVQTKGIEIVEDNPEYAIVECAAGEAWDDLVVFTVERDLGGIENMSLIPGTVGAAPIQNIGAYGQELKDTFESARIWLFDEKKIREVVHEECNFGYRDSIFKNGLKGKALILGIKLKLKKNPKLNIAYKGVRELIFKEENSKPGLQEVREAIIKLRTEKLPDPAILGNAGSFFKNPEISEESFFILQRLSPGLEGFKTKEGKIKISAAKLIELSGWKGRRTGNCGVYEKHSLVLVNYGGATGKEIVELAGSIIHDVYDKFGVKMTTEVNFI